MREPPRSLKWLVNEYRGGGWFPYIFGFTMIFALIVSGVSVLLVFTRPVTTEPWGRYSTPVYVGTVENVGNNNLPVVVRDVVDNGLPVITEPTFPVTFVRCGPPETLEIVSQRNWTISDNQGRTVFSTQGERVPLTLEPPDTDSGCDLVTTEITLEAIVQQQAGPNRPIRLRADLSDVTNQYRTVTVTSEQFYYVPTVADIPGDVSTGRVTIEIP